MRILITVLFLVSIDSVSMADIGDVYYCEMTNFVEIRGHKLTQYKPVKFKFKWESNKKVTFGSEDGIFKNATEELDHSYGSTEVFAGGDDATNMSFRTGTFIIVLQELLGAWQARLIHL